MTFLYRFKLIPLVLLLLAEVITALVVESVSPRVTWAQVDVDTQTDRLLNERIELDQVSDLQHTLDKRKEVLKFENQTSSLANEANHLLSIGDLHKSLGNYFEALQFYKESLALHRKLENHFQIANLLGNIGTVYQLLGDYPEALRYHEGSLVLNRELDNHVGEANDLLSIGNTYQALENYLKALQYYVESLVLNRELDNHLDEANSLLKIGNTYQALGNYSEALQYYWQSLVLNRELGDHVGETSTLESFGLVYRLLGDYPKALQYHEQSLILSRELGNRQGVARTLGNIGLVYGALGDYPKALQYHEQSLILSRELGNRQGVANNLLNVGSVYVLLEEYSKALRYYQESLVLQQELGNRVGIAILLNNIGGFYRLSKNYPEALQYHEESLALFRDLGNRAGEANNLNSIGLVYQLLESYPEALQYHEESLALFRDLGNRAGEANVLGNIGYLFNAQAEPELAIVFLKKAVNIYEEFRERHQSFKQDDQSKFTATVEDTYRKLADLLLQQDRILEAQRVLDLLKIQELDNYLKGVRTSENVREGSALISPEVLIADAHADILNQAITNGRRLTNLESKEESLSNVELAELETLRAERIKILQAFNKFKDHEFIQEQLELLSPAEIRQNVPLEELAALQDNLAQIPQGAVLLYPFILEDRLELVVTSPYAPPIRRTVNVSRLELNDAVKAFRYALDDPSRDAITPAQQLYDWLIAPIENDLKASGVKTIIYAPDRTLRYIPLSALYDGQQWLAERYRINHITAASLTDLNTPPNRNDRKILAGALTDDAVTINVGDKSYNFPHLPHVEDEVNAITALSPTATPLLDKDFNRARIERDANRHTILHLATHAKFLVGQPEESFILFRDKERWTLRDFKEGLLTLTRVDLVVLSACETGVDNTFGNGEEILGFGYLMQTAGARASMASLWAVDDGGTQILMSEFYKALIDGNLSKTAALQQAQLALININENRDRGGLELAESVGLDPSDLSHPYYWAPFILIGNGL